MRGFDVSRLPIRRERVQRNRSFICTFLILLILFYHMRLISTQSIGHSIHAGS